MACLVSLIVYISDDKWCDKNKNNLYYIVHINECVEALVCVPMQRSEMSVNSMYVCVKVVCAGSLFTHIVFPLPTHLLKDVTIILT